MLFTPQSTSHSAPTDRGMNLPGAKRQLAEKVKVNLDLESKSLSKQSKHLKDARIR